MKTVAQITLLLTVALILGSILAVGGLFMLYYVLVICLFYTKLMWFLVGAVSAGLTAWIFIKLYERRKGKKYEIAR